MWAARFLKSARPNITCADAATSKMSPTLKTSSLKVANGTPVYVKNVGTVHLGPDLRRGVAELDGKGEVVGGIVVMRYGENALNVIDGIKKKLEEIKSSLPEGVEIVPTYDRSNLINRSIATLREKLIEESIVVALVCLFFSGTSARRSSPSSLCPSPSFCLSCRCSGYCI